MSSGHTQPVNNSLSLGAFPANTKALWVGEVAWMIAAFSENTQSRCVVQGGMGMQCMPRTYTEPMCSSRGMGMQCMPGKYTEFEGSSGGVRVWSIPENTQSQWVVQGPWEICGFPLKYTADE